jgi:hypothetical protein
MHNCERPQPVPRKTNMNTAQKQVPAMPLLLLLPLLLIAMPH